jgi:hypothetical protein
VQNENKERWEILCQQAAVELDPQKLLLLVRELNDALKEREQRLHPPHNTNAAGSSKGLPDAGDGPCPPHNS